MPVPELIVQTCRTGHYELGPQHKRPGWEARQGAITGRPSLSCSPYSESLQRTDTPDATSHRVCGIWVHRTGLRCTSLHRLQAATVFYPLFYPKRQRSGVEMLYLLVTAANWGSRPECASSLPSWSCGLATERRTGPRWRARVGYLGWRPMSPGLDPERCKTPRVPDGERSSLESWLKYHRATLLVKCAGLTPEQLATRSCEVLVPVMPALTISPRAIRLTSTHRSGPPDSRHVRTTSSAACDGGASCPSRR